MGLFDKDHDDDRTLRAILDTLQQSLAIQQQMQAAQAGNTELLMTLVAETLASKQILVNILQVEQASMGYLAQIASELNHPPITGFTPIKEITMALVPLAPGFTATFGTTPIPATSVPIAANLKWTSSDTTNAPVSPNPADASGLTTLVAFPTTAVVGTSFTLSLNYTNADGTVANQAATFTIVAAPLSDVTGFTEILQTA